MPIYVYQVILEGDDAEEGQIFEVVQSMEDPPLTHHPVTGQPVRRIIQPPNLPQQYTDRQARRILSDDNLARKGFARYEKTTNGSYRKTAGQGPDTLSSKE